jgi:hypothetical protein
MQRLTHIEYAYFWMYVSDEEFCEKATRLHRNFKALLLESKRVAEEVASMNPPPGFVKNLSSNRFNDAELRTFLAKA